MDRHLWRRSAVTLWFVDEHACALFHLFLDRCPQLVWNVCKPSPTTNSLSSPVAVITGSRSEHLCRWGLTQIVFCFSCIILCLKRMPLAKSYPNKTKRRQNFWLDIPTINLKMYKIMVYAFHPSPLFILESETGFLVFIIAVTEYFSQYTCTFTSLIDKSGSDETLL